MRGKDHQAWRRRRLNRWTGAAATAKGAVLLGVRFVLIAAFVAAQPALAGMDGLSAAKPKANAYEALIEFVNSGGSAQLAAAEHGATDPAAADYALLQNFLASDHTGEDVTGKEAPDDDIHASLRPNASYPDPTQRSALVEMLGLNSAPAALGSGEAPHDAIHARLVSGQPNNPDAALVAYAEGIAEKPVKSEGSDTSVLVAAAEEKPAAKKHEAGEAHYIGSQACVACHRNQVGAFNQTLHGDVLLHHPRNENEKLGCESCHGPGSKHAETKEGDGGEPGDIIAFRKDSPRPVEERNAICLSCHERADRTYWKGSAHETQNIACTNCHELMQKVSPKFQMAKSTEAETCFQCHKDRRAQFERPSHHPLREGDMTCSSCHNPHGSATDKLLREASVNETCYKCHADKRGPFLWEHEPVRDNCLNCHEPHGTVNENLLKVQRPRLCSLCHMGPGHGMPGNPMTVQSVNRSCQNCHTKVHGSNSPAGSLFQR